MREKGLSIRSRLIFPVIPDILYRRSRFPFLSLQPLLCHFDPWEKSLVRERAEISLMGRNDKYFAMSGIEKFLCGVSSPHVETLLFRQKCSKPFSPVRGPMGIPPPQYRIKWLGNSLRSNSPRQRVEFGSGQSRAQRIDRKISYQVIQDFYERSLCWDDLARTYW